MGNHEHDHNHDGEEEELQIISLPEDDGEEHEYAIYDVIEVNEQEYFVCLPFDGESLSNDGIRFLKAKPLNDDEVELSDIEDDEEFEAVCDAFEEMLDDEEFEDA